MAYNPHAKMDTTTTNSPSKFDDSFGVNVPPLKVYLKKVLNRYPEGGQVLKEQVQNADDAGARRVIFLYDKTEHSTQTMWSDPESDTLSELNGPSLFVFNDATFKDSDWMNIQNPEQSGKQDDPTKIGRFGLGFISVYHLTDVPSILSGQQIGFLDPHEKYFGKRARGKKWPLNCADTLDKFPDQFSPYINPLFNCSRKSFEQGHFEGTIFRFPLRKANAESELSSTVWDDARVYDLFKQFQADAEISLLFLKNIQSVEFYEKASAEEKPKMLFSVEIPTSAGPEGDHLGLQSDKTAFLKAAKLKQTTSSSWNVSITTQDYNHGLQNTAMSNSTSEYLTVNTSKNEGISKDLKDLVGDRDLNLLPWVGVSMQLDVDHSKEGITGRSFCFLPLPDNPSMRTGLPIHVHGYFGLDDNRGSIQWPNEEAKQDKARNWNQLLVKEVFPDSYAQLVEAAIQSGTSADVVYSAWPKISTVKDNWKTGVRNFLHIIKDKPVLYTSVNGGSWKKPQDVFIANKDEVIQKVLEKKGYPVADIPGHVIDALSWGGVETKIITPDVLRTAIRGDSLDWMNRQDKMQLLKYILEDKKFQDLKNIHLLPLADGSFTSFSNANAVYIPTAQIPGDIFPNMASRFTADDMPEILYEAQPHTQLKSLTHQMVPNLLKDALPTDWMQGDDVVVNWYPGKPQQPEVSWLERFWTWINKQTPTVLFNFINFPLVQLMMSNGNHRLARLRENTLIYHEKKSNYPRQDDLSMTESMCRYLERLGAVVIQNDLPEFIAQHPYIDRIILSPDASGVAAVLTTWWSTDAIEYVATCSNGLRYDIRYLFSHGVLSETFKELLRQLPIFEGTDGKCVSVSKCKLVIPNTFHDIPVKRLRQRFLVEKQECDSLAIKLGAVKKSKVEFVECVLADIQTMFYDPKECREIMGWLLQNAEYDHAVRNVSFVPTGAGLRSPANLFPPDDTHLRNLFKGQSVFPIDEYAGGTLLDCLKRVGMKNVSSVTAQELLEIAVSLSESKDRDVASALLQHISNYPSLLSINVTRNYIGKSLGKFLQDRAWVPCQSTKPASYPDSVGWNGSCGQLYNPDDVALLDQADFLGSVKPLVEVLNVNEELQKFFGWGEVNPSRYPTVKEVAQHLQNVANSYQEDRDVQPVTRIVQEIYAFLNQAPPRHLENVFNNNNTELVWHGNGFTTPNEIAFSSGRIGVNLAPYLHVLPPSLRKYDNLFKALGVKEQFDEEALSKVLQSIQEKHLHQEVITDKETDLKLVCDILTSIVSLSSPSTSVPDVFVPCREQHASCENKLRMFKASECLYVDEERLLDEYNRGECNSPVVHQMVPNDIAKRLRLRPLSHSVAPVDSVDLGYDIEGPHQSTVNAIKRNLEMYKEGLDIFKEMIQNADDAGATEVKFLIDWRENTQSRNRLLSDGMEMCHGPALWAYNNATFTEDDVTNICSIAAASKKEDLEKIGRFGLGFTSVYHVTDVPSVVSGSFILIFDPRTNHLGNRVNHGRPGIRLDIRRESHRATLRSYPNQFQPFQGIFGCDLSPSGAGCDKTLFRLPLRTPREVADTSQDYLSHAIYNSQGEMDKMVMALKESASSLLLFTQNVTQVSVHTLGADSSSTDTYETLLDVSVDCVKILPRCIQSKENKTVQRQILKATAEQMKHTSTTIPESTCVLKVTNKTQVTKRKGKKDQKAKEHLFVVSSCMATGRALDMASSAEGKKAGVLPCGGVAVQLEAGMEGLIPVSLPRDQNGKLLGSAFSYLPLNVNTRLPFHINGSFLLQPNRRQLWSKASSASSVKEGGEFEARWNVCLMEEVLSKAFTNLLLDLQVLQEEDYLDARQFQTLWPWMETTESDFHPLVEAFYKHTCGLEATKLIYNGNRWVSIHDCFFINESLKAPDVQKSIIAVLNQKLSPKKWVQIDDSILKSMTIAKADTVVCGNTYDLSRFLAEFFFPILNNDDDILPEYRNQITIHLLDLRIGTEKQNQYDDELRQTECIPVSPNGEELVSPDQLVHPGKPIGKLFNENDARFPYGEEYQRRERLVSLEELGMATDDLGWDDVCEVARTLGTCGSSNADMIAKIAILLKLIDKKLYNKDIPTAEQIERLKDAPFLPVLSKPSDYPMTWYSASTAYMSASELYEAKHKRLIGSIQPILDEDCIGRDSLTERALDFLGIRQKPIKVEDVISQLRLTVDMNQDVVAPATARICHSIYGFLNDTLCPSSDESLTERNCAEFLDELRSIPFILVGGRFLRCDQVAFTHQRQSGTYLFTFPQELDGFRKLFRVCGVCEAFGTRDFIKVLGELKDKYQARPLSENDILVAKDVLAALADECDVNDYRHDILVPDSGGVLTHISELVYNDIPWETENQELTYPYDRITTHEVDRFGIRTCRQLQLESCSSGQGFENPFGQTEELTSRLKGILREYDHIPDVFKELLQNADDAKATEIHFVYDPRQRTDAKLVSDSWTAIDTLPALCVYNDKEFSPDDLTGIQKVGVGGKLTDSTTTGRFGIGFNATYHLTDCPTFVSDNKHLCVFDPQIKYVPGATRDKPGMLYTVDGEDGCNAKFPDMMEGYLGDLFKLDGATMFRFPLRSAQMARESEISSTSFLDSKVETLLKDFEAVARESLLFLNHIKKISISQINKHTGALSPRYVIKASVDREGEAMQKELAEHLSEHKDKLVMEIPPLNKVYTMEVEDSRGKKESWLVSQAIGVHNPEGAFYDDNRLKTKTHLPRGGTAALIQTHQPNQSSVGSSSNEISNRRYKAFCFLPLQIYTDLPIHVNGSFVLDQSRRHLVKGEEYCESNSEGFIHKWNRLLLKHVIAPGYAFLIERAGRILLNPNAENFQSNLNSNQRLYDRLFPLNIDTLEQEWNLLAVSALQYIANNNLEVLPVVRETVDMSVTWYHATSNISKAFFDNLAVSVSVSVSVSDRVGSSLLSKSNDCTILRRFFHATDFKLLSSSPKVCYALQKAGVEAAFVSSKSVLQHLGSLGYTDGYTVPCKVEESTFKTVEDFRAVLEYCLTGTENINELKGTPLCLTNDGTLNLFTATTAAYVTHQLDVLSSQPQCFIHKDLVHVFHQWFNTDEENRKQAFESGLLKDFTIYELSARLGAQLPPEWQGQNQHIKWTPGKDGHPEKEWMQNLWKFILSVEGEDGPKECLEVLRDWPIIPTRQGTLVPPSLAHTVLFLDEFTDSESRQEVVHVLRIMGCAEVDIRQMFHTRYTCNNDPPRKLTELLMSYLVVPTSQSRVLGVIRFIEDSDKKLETERLSENDCHILLRYFQEGCKKFSVDDINTLKSLAVFYGANGQLTNISNHQHCHILPYTYNMPEYQQCVWMRAADCLFLKPLLMLGLLCEILQISNISLAEIYLKYILPNFEVLNMESKLAYIEHIRDALLGQTQSQEDLILALKNTAFIFDEQEVLRCATYFFDPKNLVFGAMKGGDRLLHRLLPKPFCEDQKWLVFLRSIGLNCEVTQTLFLEFAHEIEHKTSSLLPNEEVKDISEKAMVLISELDRNKQLHESAFLTSIAEIKFIPSVPINKELLEIHPACPDNTTFISYKGSVSELHKDLVWSVAKILPYAAIPNRRNQWQLGKTPECLGIGTAVTLEKVLSHTQNICHHMAERNPTDEEDDVPRKVRKKFNSIMEKVYTHLKKHLKKDGEVIKQRLVHTPICLVDDGCFLVKADQMVKRLDDHVKLEPYIYETPRGMEQFDNVFKLLGTTDRITFDQLAKVLATLRDHCIETLMHPTEWKTAHTAVYLMFDLLGQTAGKCPISVNKLYLPTPDNHLMLSTELYHADAHDIANLELTSTDIKFIVPLKQCGLIKLSESKFIGLLPIQLRPNDLKSKMCEKPCDSNQECEAEEDCQYLKHVQKMITSEEMQRVMHRLIQCQNKGSPLNDKQKKDVAVLVGNITIKCFIELKTGYFDVDGNEIMIRKKSRRVFHLQQQHSDGHILYIEHADVTQIPHHVLHKIAEKVNYVCGKVLDYEQMQRLTAVLGCQDLDGMNTLLTEEYEIQEYDVQCGGIQPDTARPGLVVPLDIRHLLVDSMMNLFRPGEIAAYRRPLEEDVQSLHDPGAMEQAVVDAENEEVGELIYVEIKERLSLGRSEYGEEHGILRRYKIDIGTEEMITVRVTMLYKFRRPKLPTETALVPFAGNPETDLPPEVNECLPEDLEAAQNLIRDSIRTAMMLPERERGEVVRRLYRQWHPDKNREQQDLANEAFKFLTAELERTGITASYTRQFRSWNADINRETAEAHRYQEQYYSRQGSNQSRSHDSEKSASFVPPSYSHERPDPRNARLWYRQAEDDLQSATECQQNGATNLSWTAFKIQQSVEKALIAAKYSQNGKPNLRSHELRTLVMDVRRHTSLSLDEDQADELENAVSRIIRMECDFNKTRYPENLSSRTSLERYAGFPAEEAVTETKKILEIVREIIGIRVY